MDKCEEFKSNEAEWHINRKLLLHYLYPQEKENN